MREDSEYWMSTKQVAAKEWYDWTRRSKSGDVQGEDRCELAG